MVSIDRPSFRRACRLIGWLLVLAVTVLSLIPLELPEGGDKWSHLFAYGALMLWFSMLHSGRARVALGLVAMGIVIEFLQGQTGYRSFDVLDMLANALGVLAGWVVALTPVGRLFQWLEMQLAGRP